MLAFHFLASCATMLFVHSLTNPKLNSAKRNAPSSPVVFLPGERELSVKEIRAMWRSVARLTDSTCRTELTRLGREEVVGRSEALCVVFEARVRAAQLDFQKLALESREFKQHMEGRDYHGLQRLSKRLGLRAVGKRAVLEKALLAHDAKWLKLRLSRVVESYSS